MYMNQYPCKPCPNKARSRVKQNFEIDVLTNRIKVRCCGHEKMMLKKRKEEIRRCFGLKCWSGFYLSLRFVRYVHKSHGCDDFNLLLHRRAARLALNASALKCNVKVTLNCGNCFLICVSRRARRTIRGF